MKRIFILKVGQLYLREYSLMLDRPDSYFIGNIEYTSDKERAYVFYDESYKDFKRIIYLISGIELEVEILEEIEEV